MDQYKATNPGGYEAFFSDREAALEHFNTVPHTTLWRAGDDTDGKWVVLDRTPGPEEYKELRDLLKFD